MTGFRRVLVANRGEIACRIIRSIHALGYQAVAVYSAADAEAPHVAAADFAVAIGPAAATESYLSIPRLLDAARISGADAVHPGYGFLSENADFAEACGSAGLIFIGPPPDAIRAMGNKARAKNLVLAAGVPCVPGYQAQDQSDERLVSEAARIGFPIMVKAASGGGGRGMRLVTSAAGLPAALTAARSEALNAFGADDLILEKAILDARHVEIQIFADTQGNVIHLGERDCSIQRRHQKVIEEAPSPAVTPAIRSAMGAVAIAAARAIGYVGAGTVEFLLGPDGTFYFLEMNTRLQVEHPVTEMVTGLDLVAWQLRIAAGAPLPLRQAEIAFSGHAIEARLYAEDAAAGFLPQSGRVVAWEPPTGPGIRVDHGLATGLSITPFYDPMIAKIIAHGIDREEARRRLIAALERCVVLGVETNRGFLIDCLRHEVFAAGAATTAFLARDLPVFPRARPTPIVVALAAALLFRTAPATATPLLAGWRPTGPLRVPMRLRLNNQTIAVEIADHADGAFVVCGPEAVTALTILADDGRRIRFTTDERTATAAYAVSDRDGQALLHVAHGADSFECEDVTLSPPDTERAAHSGAITAPMNSVIRAVRVTAGERVVRGQPLIVLEAMKMQHEILAPAEGVVLLVSVKPGDQVKPRTSLVDLTLDTPETS
jgi:geranyl-CoA carboxylase alpha subunit